MDATATLSLYSDNVPGRRVEVVDNVGGGIELNHHAVANLDADLLVSGNGGGGLRVRNGSMAISHINNAAQITGATNNSCVNLSSDDEPGAP